MKVWENSKKLWKHSPAARVPTAFLVLSNFHSCGRTRYQKCLRNTLFRLPSNTKDTSSLKKLWKHSPAAHVPTTFLILPNFHSRFYNSIETRRTCFLFLKCNHANGDLFTSENSTLFLRVKIHVYAQKITWHFTGANIISINIIK